MGYSLEAPVGSNSAVDVLQEGKEREWCVDMGTCSRWGEVGPCIIHLFKHYVSSLAEVKMKTFLHESTGANAALAGPGQHLQRSFIRLRGVQSSTPGLFQSEPSQEPCAVGAHRPAISTRFVSPQSGSG